MHLQSSAFYTKEAPYKAREDRPVKRPYESYLNFKIVFGVQLRQHTLRPDATGRRWPLATGTPSICGNTRVQSVRGLKVT